MRSRKFVYSSLLLLAITTLAAAWNKFLFSLVCCKGRLSSKAMLLLLLLLLELAALTGCANTILKLKTASTVLLAMKT